RQSLQRRAVTRCAPCSPLSLDGNDGSLWAAFREFALRPRNGHRFCRDSAPWHRPCYGVGSNVAGASSLGSTSRIVAVDAARGCAMLLVCAAHVDNHFASTSPLLQTLFITITRT